MGPANRTVSCRGRANHPSPRFDLDRPSSLLLAATASASARNQALSSVHHTRPDTSALANTLVLHAVLAHVAPLQLPPPPPHLDLTRSDLIRAGAISQVAVPGPSNKRPSAHLRPCRPCVSAVSSTKAEALLLLLPSCSRDCFHLSCRRPLPYLPVHRSCRALRAHLQRRSATDTDTDSRLRLV